MGKPIWHIYVKRFNGGKRDGHLNEMLFPSPYIARVVIAALAENNSREHMHSALGYETAAASATELNKK